MRSLGFGTEGWEMVKRLDWPGWRVGGWGRWMVLGGSAPAHSLRLPLPSAQPLGCDLRGHVWGRGLDPTPQPSRRCPPSTTVHSHLSLVSGSQSPLALCFFSFPVTYQASPLCYFKVSSNRALTDVTHPPTACRQPPKLPHGPS